MSVENLLLALDNTYKTYSFYALASALDEIFINLKNTEVAHINALTYQLQKLNVAIPNNPYLNTIVLPNSIEEVLQTALIQENANITLYNDLTANEQDAEVLDVFYRLQATSFNNHIPALHTLMQQNAREQENALNVMDMLNNSKELLNQTGEMVAKLKDGNLTQDQLESFLGKLNYSLMGGVIAGAFGVIIFNELLNQNKE
ncbi:hypothetical protein [Helicobacter turcicus]|uniref:DUF2202 domain-containing protein n=1 Tax=Helicobacter turcicus TaxID=2867412 RepID=A0ABS7JPX8_9HELI|nr:hypothetical protein [Helicobacter turcicus]MBX7491417.1 hypothetical protein [Helicobacter turcicus]MBX7546284.1 hypothetical protein [Helicobacter turcicus]